jgi:alpha-amylase/alpha-mannosidase (GH57 family)
MERYICIHGHFYQPPRENPWLEEVEIEDSASPYHDWNERITAECYAPNAASRLLDGAGRIVNIVNNYARISFNFGPTLLAWMEKHAPDVYAAILQADSMSREARSGHGNALAQIYNHLIMPLAHPRDKRTQVRWGIDDFVHRFKRAPEGMWLPETAVDLESLDIMAGQGITFCILAPHQAAAVKKSGAARWADVGGGRIDTTQAYRCALPSGRTLGVFFYNGPLSHALAFDGLLDKGEDFAARLLAGFREQGQGSQLLSIATDGESYGHHHKFGDMALAAALHRIEADRAVQLTNYGEYLEKFPPLFEVQISENTSWSCAHGLERWHADCGCNSGGHPGWRQQWRAPLRRGLDWLRDEIAPLFEEKGREVLQDPWAARDAYVEVILDRSEGNRNGFLERHAGRTLADDEKTTALALLEMQRQALLMYTSCGWFFDDISGLETVQILRYADRTMQLAERLFGRSFESPFREILAEAKSNLPEYQDGQRVYDLLVKPARVDLRRVAAHYAISSLMKEYDEATTIYIYSIKKTDYAALQSGEARLALGRITISSAILPEAADLCFAVLHLGGHIFSGGLDACNEAYESSKREMLGAFTKGDIADTMRLMDGQFGRNAYSLVHLFRDEQRKILHFFSEKMMNDLERGYRLIYEIHRTLMAFSQEAGIPVPKEFLAAAEFILAWDIKSAFLAERVDVPRIRGLLGEVKKWRLALDGGESEFVVRRKAEERIARWWSDPSDPSLCTSFLETAELLREFPWEINYWQLQNTYFAMARSIYGEYEEKAQKGDEAAARWGEAFRRIGELLFFDTAAI